MSRMQVSLMDMDVHGYLDVSVVYGRKPSGSQEQASIPAVV
jgi:uncharacterized protein YaeQ